jgi:hypothetical protein
VFGHKWEPAQGVIAAARTEQVASGAHHGLQERHMYVIDVRTAEGRAFQATLPVPAGLRRPLEPGTAVHVEVNPKTGEVRFDPSHPADQAASGQITSLREAVHMAREMRGAAGGGGLSATLAHLGEAAAAAAAAGQFEHGGAPGARVIGGAEAAELVQGLLGGGDRAAALARIRQIRAEAMGQAGGQTGPDGMPIVTVSQTTHLTGVTGPPASAPAEPETFHSNEPSTFTPVDPNPPTGAFGPAAPTGFTPVTPPPVSRGGAFGEDSHDEF